MSKGLVVREGIIELRKAIFYAKQNKMPFIDMRANLTFANEEQLNRNLTILVSNAFRRPIRVDLSNFFTGECFGKQFVAILPHNFINDFAETTRKSPKDILSYLAANESLI